MPNGWERLGDALAGTSGARRADIEAKTINALANRDQNVADARMKMERARHATQDSIGSYFLDLASDDPQKVARAKAGIALSGINYNTLEGGLARRQEQGFRQGAVDAAESGDWALANARLSGVASGPVEIPKVSGNMLLSNRLIPGGGDVTVTPIGQSQIRANDARAKASIINANKPRSSGGGGRSGAPKLGEIEKMRMTSELKALDPLIQSALDEVARNQGATAGPGVRKLADAEARLADLQKRQQAIFDKYEGGMAAPVEMDDTPNEPDDGIPVVDSGRSLGESLAGDVYYQPPAGGQRRAPESRQQYRDAFAIARKYEAEAEAAIKAGAPRDMVRARLKAMIEQEMGR